MRGHDLLPVAVFHAITIVNGVAQTLTLTFPNGPTVVQIFKTNANGFPSRANIATLGGSTSPTSSPLMTSSTPFSTLSTSQTSNTPHPNGSLSAKKAKGTPAAVIAGISVAVVILIALSLTLLLLKRRKRHRRRLSVKVELDPVGSPVADKYVVPDPFLTDTQARGMGYNTSQLSTRRIAAKFSSTDEPDRTINTPLDLHIPRILLTRDGDTSGRPISSSSGHHGSQNLVGHITASSYVTDVKLPGGPRSSLPPSPTAVSSSDTLTEGPLMPSAGTATPSQIEITQRMEDLLSQLESHTAVHTSDSGMVVTQLQRQVEMLRCENEELRLTGSDAPPAYDGH